MKSFNSRGNLIFFLMLAITGWMGGMTGRAERPVPPSQVFLKWQVDHFDESSELTSQASADPDGDGLVNALEFLLGGHPLDPSSSPRPLMEVGVATEIVFSFTAAVSYGMALRFCTSTDLTLWVPVASRSAMGGAWDIHLANAAVTVDEATGQVSITTPQTGNEVRFVRLEILADTASDHDTEDADADGTADWLEIYVERLPGWQDSDGDTLSDQVELLTGGDPDIDEVKQRQMEQASFPTGLNVFTPIDGP